MGHATPPFQCPTTCRGVDNTIIKYMTSIHSHDGASVSVKLLAVLVDSRGTLICFLPLLDLFREVLYQVGRSLVIEMCCIC